MVTMQNATEVDINIDEESKKLDKRWEELSDMQLNPPGPDPVSAMEQKDRIRFWLTDIVFKQTLLQEIKNEKNAAKITITGISEQQKIATEQAMVTLSKKIKQAQVFDNVITAVSALLGAANQVILTAAK